MPSQFSTAARNAAVDAMETSFGTAPTLRIRTGTMPANCAAARQGTILGSVVLASDWLGDAASGVKTAAAIPEFSAIADGTAGHFEIMQGSTCVWQGDCGLSGSGAALILGALAVATGQIFRITSLTLTAGGA